MPHRNAHTVDSAALFGWFHAITHEEVETIASLIGQRIPIESLHPLRQTTALAEVARRGQRQLAILLLQHGAAPDFLCGRKPTTPLHIALKNQHWELLDLLLGVVDSAARCDAQGRNLLHVLSEMAIGKADFGTVLRLAELIIAKGAAVNALDDAGITPLHYAVINDWEALVSLLLMRDANPNIRVMESGVTPLIAAALDDNRPMARLLLQYKADPLLAMPGGRTALSIMPELVEDIPEALLAEIIRLHPEASSAKLLKPRKK